MVYKKDVINLPQYKKLNLGCGAYTLPGYVNIDMQPPADVIGDFTEIQFSDVTEIRMSHILEHLPWSRVPEILHNLRLSMVRDAEIIIEVPDMEYIMQRGVYDRFAEIAIYGIQSAPGEYHQAGFTQQSLALKLTDAGFTVSNWRVFLSEHEARPGFPCIEVIGKA
jgi:predicted SAM-dependent methyltransferase